MIAENHNCYNGCDGNSRKCFKMLSLSPSRFHLSKINCEKVAYSAKWGLDKTLEVMRHCTGADKEGTLTES